MHTHKFIQLLSAAVAYLALLCKVQAEVIGADKAVGKDGLDSPLDPQTIANITKAEELGGNVLRKPTVGGSAKQQTGDAVAKDNGQSKVTDHTASGSASETISVDRSLDDDEDGEDDDTGSYQWISSSGEL